MARHLVDTLQMQGAVILHCDRKHEQWLLRCVQLFFNFAVTAASQMGTTCVTPIESVYIDEGIETQLEKRGRDQRNHGCG